MDIESFAQGPLSWSVFLLFFLAILIRTSLSLFSISKSEKNKPFSWKYLFTSSGGLFIPLHRAIIKKPIYTTLRYIFHLCMIIVPIGLAGHIVMVESSSLELSWPAIPDPLADLMTITFIVLGVGFLFRRILLVKIRRQSSVFDYLFITICLLPFISGYFLAHGTLDAIPFFLDHLFLIHILSAELMILTTVFLFIRSRLDKKTCTGCGARQIECPTGTLNFYEINNQRIFTHSPYSCISCGACINVCPEEAAGLSHQVNLKSFFNIFGRQKIQSVQMHICQKCGQFYVPEPQREKIAATITDHYLHFCPRCKKVNYAEGLRSPKKTILAKQDQLGGN